MNPAEMAPINVERVRTRCIAISLNVQRRTLNAERLMRELASSFHISFGRSDAREENFDGSSASLRIALIFGAGIIDDFAIRPNQRRVSFSSLRQTFDL